MKEKGWRAELMTMWVWLLVGMAIAVAFLQAIGLWPVEWRFQ